MNTTFHRRVGKGGGYLFNSALPLSLASQTLRHYLVDYYREVSSAYN